MSNLAASYSAAGRHEDALVLKVKTLEFQRRVLPENHPELGTACFNLSTSLAQAGDFRLAIERAHEALRIWQATLPQSHPHVYMAQERVRQLEDKVALRT